MRLAAQKFYSVDRAEFSGFFNCQIKAAAPAFRKSFDNARSRETNAELKTWLARLCNDEFRSPDAVAVADIHACFR